MDLKRLALTATLIPMGAAAQEPPARLDTLRELARQPLALDTTTIREEFSRWHPALLQRLSWIEVTAGQLPMGMHAMYDMKEDVIWYSDLTAPVRYKERRVLERLRWMRGPANAIKRRFVKEMEQTYSDLLDDRPEDSLSIVGATNHELVHALLQQDETDLQRPTYPAVGAFFADRYGRYKQIIENVANTYLHGMAPGIRRRYGSIPAFIRKPEPARTWELSKEQTRIIAARTGEFSTERLPEDVKETFGATHLDDPSFTWLAGDLDRDIYIHNEHPEYTVRVARDTVMPRWSVLRRQQPYPEGVTGAAVAANLHEQQRLRVVRELEARMINAIADTYVGTPRADRISPQRSDLAFFQDYRMDGTAVLQPFLERMEIAFDLVENGASPEAARRTLRDATHYRTQDDLYIWIPTPAKVTVRSAKNR